MQDLIERRQRCADRHDQARARWAHASPDFGREVAGVARELEGLVGEMTRRGAPAAELGRTLMWLGDAQFDLAQGRHAPLEPALASYRRAEDFVAAASDRVLSAKYDANYANILLKGAVTRDVLDDVIARYERALPVLREQAPAAVPAVEDMFRKASSMQRDLHELARRHEGDVAEVAKLLAELSRYDLDPPTLAATQGKLEHLVSLGAPSTVAELTTYGACVQGLFRDLMELATMPQTQRPGRAAEVARLCLGAWQTVQTQVLTAHVDKTSRDEACRLTRALVAAQAALERTGDAGVLAEERARLRALARESRRFVYRHHVTWANPLWRASNLAPDPNGVFVAGTSVDGGVDARIRAHGLTKLEASAGLAPADGRFDAMRRASVVVVPLSRSQRELAAACYDVGIALVLGKPLVVVAPEGLNVPFDVDVQPVPEGAEAAFVAALDAALYLPQRAASAEKLEGLARAARARFQGLQHLTDELGRHAAAPLEAAGVLGAIVAESNRTSGAARVVVHPAWPRPFEAEPAYLFHVTPFREVWSAEASSRVERTVTAGGRKYVRHDHVDSPRIIASLWRSLCQATWVLVDLTGLNANVALECGVAHALGKKTLLVGQPGTVRELFPSLAQVQVREYSTMSELGELVGRFAR